MDQFVLCGNSRRGLSRDHQAVYHGLSGQIVRYGRGRFHPAPWNGAGLPTPVGKTINSAGTASSGKRQALQFSHPSKGAIEEHDIWGLCEG